MDLIGEYLLVLVIKLLNHRRENKLIIHEKYGVEDEENYFDSDTIKWRCSVPAE